MSSMTNDETWDLIISKMEKIEVLKKGAETLHFGISTENGLMKDKIYNRIDHLTREIFTLLKNS